MEAYADDLMSPHPPNAVPGQLGRGSDEHASTDDDAPGAPLDPVTRLARRRGELRLRLALLEPTADVAALTGDLAEEAQDHEHERRLAAMRRLVRGEIVRVELALERAARGLYGICADCGHAIAPRRLEIVPAASLCVHCQARREALGLAH
jgi:RNA polymerase-binding transcription factor DksA